MSEPREDKVKADRISEFDKEIEELLSSGADATEQDKLEQIVWASSVVIDGVTVPGTAVLAAIERYVDHAGLPESQRDMLKNLRAKVDAGRMDGEQPAEDSIGIALAKIVDTGMFEESLDRAKRNQDEPWAEMPEFEKVRLLVKLALEAEPYPDICDSMGPPGAYVLETIERQVDYSKLPPWWREPLEEVRRRLDRGELGGDDLYEQGNGDRVELALRMADLAGSVAQCKVRGEIVKRPVRVAWSELSEEEKLDRIKGEIRFLRLNAEPGAIDVIGREVDVTKVADWRREAFQNERREEWGEWEDAEDLAGQDAGNVPAGGPEPDAAGRYDGDGFLAIVPGHDRGAGANDSASRGRFQRKDPDDAR
jgi:hypothetical protein